MSDLIELVESRLESVLDPCSVAAGNPMNIVEMGLIDRIEVSSGEVHVYLCLTSPTCSMLEHFSREADRVLDDVRDQVGAVVLHPDTGMSWTPSRLSHDARSRRRQHLLTLA
jgi:metal-sulfur cluster biosynthetic enzyme